jgi:hypothetical protein
MTNVSGVLPFGFHEEKEVTVGVPPSQFCTVFQAFAVPVRVLPIDGRIVRFGGAAEATAFYLFLANEAPGESDRLVLDLIRGSFSRVKYSQKRWIEVDSRWRKFEKRYRLESISACFEFLLKEGRPIVSSFVKRKWSLRYGKRKEVKIRLDCVVPFDPASRCVGEAFWDLEVESECEIQPQQIAAVFLNDSGVQSRLPVPTLSKKDRCLLREHYQPKTLYELQQGTTAVAETVIPLLDEFSTLRRSITCER